MAEITTVAGYEKPIGGEKHSRAMHNRNIDRSEAVALAVDKLPKGLVFQAHVASASGAVIDAIVNNIPSFTFKANRKYRIVWDFSYLMSGNSDSLFYCSIGWAPLTDAASLLTNITVVDGRTKFVQIFAGASTGHTGPITKYHQQGAGDLTTQIKFRVQRVYGDDSITIIGNANERAVYSIFDDGAADGSFG